MSAGISDPVLEALPLYRFYGHRVTSQTQGVAVVSASYTTISLEVVVVCNHCHRKLLFTPHPDTKTYKRTQDGS